MVSVTVSLPEEIKKKMEQFPEINWSGLVRRIIEEKVKELKWKEEMRKKLAGEDEFEDWAVEMGRKLKTSATQSLKREKIL